MLLTIPPPPVDNLELGPLTLHLYGLLIGIGVILALQVIERAVAWQGLPRERIGGVAIPGVIAGFIGARIYHLLSKPDYYLDNPGQALKIWEGGLGIWGGVLLGTLTGALLWRRQGLPVKPLLDAAAPAIMVAQALGRWGNYVNQELFGRPLDTWWALEVEREFRPAAFADVRTFHPTFLYESLFNLALAGVLLLLIRKWSGRAPGVVFAIYAAAYSLARFFIEGLRVDPAHEWGGLRQNEWVSLAVVVLATVAAIVLQVRHRRRTRAAAATAD